jgi:predicted AlkP superfamily pyrophosphatase or phosphodiesterase
MRIIPQFFMYIILCIYLFVSCCASNPEINIPPNTESSTRINVPAKHLVFIGFDGLGGAYIPKSDMPSLKRMIDKGSSSLEVRNVKPSVSWPNWTSIFFGSPQEYNNTEQSSSIFTAGNL